MERTNNPMEDTKCNCIDRLNAKIADLSKRNKELEDIIKDNLKRLDEAARLLEIAHGIASIMKEGLLNNNSDTAIDTLNKVEYYILKEYLKDREKSSKDEKRDNPESRNK